MILEYPQVSQRWISKRGSPHTDADIDRIYKNYLAGTMDTLVANSKLIDGTVEAMAQLRSRGCKIGSTTGYLKPIMEKLGPMAAKEGYTPDCYVTSDEVPVARPSPSMIFLNMVCSFFDSKRPIQGNDRIVFSS